MNRIFLVFKKIEIEEYDYYAEEYESSAKVALLKAFSSEESADNYIKYLYECQAEYQKLVNKCNLCAIHSLTKRKYYNNPHLVGCQELSLESKGNKIWCNNIKSDNDYLEERYIKRIISVEE